MLKNSFCFILFLFYSIFSFSQEAEIKEKETCHCPGMAKAGIANDKINERAAALGIQYTPSGFPVEIYSLSGKLGAQMRATITEFGPVLLLAPDEANPA